MNRKSQLETGSWQRWLALGCITLVLVFCALEATHAHSDARPSRNSVPCTLCISGHAKALGVSFHAAPLLVAVEIVPVPFFAEGKNIGPELTLFIRPPPAV